MTRVAIIGAGPGGAALGALLARDNVDFTIFERDTSVSSRAQGGSLDLHEQQGILALKKAGLHAEFLQHARFDGEAMWATDQHLNTMLRIDGATADTSNGRPEMDRSKLREILVAAIPPERLRWAAPFARLVRDPAGRTSSVELADGSREDGFDLVVGADGANSRVRAVLTDVKPAYAGVAAFWGCISRAEERYPALVALIRKGSWFAFGDHRMFAAQWTGAGSIFLVCEMATPAGYAQRCGFDVTDPVAIKRALHDAFFPAFHRTVHDCVDALDDDITYRDLTMLPVGVAWPPVRGVTALGDAAHLMTHFGGVGVNQALADAVDLAAVIAASDRGADLHAGVARFEQAMFARAEPAARLSYGNMFDMMLADDAGTPAAMKRIGARMASQPGNYDVAISETLSAGHVEG